MQSIFLIQTAFIIDPNETTAAEYKNYLQIYMEKGLLSSYTYRHLLQHIEEVLNARDSGDI